MSSSPKESAKAADVTEEDTRDFVLPETGSKKKGGKGKLYMYIGLGYGVGMILWFILAFFFLIERYGPLEGGKGWPFMMYMGTLVYPIQMTYLVFTDGGYTEVGETYKHHLLNPSYGTDGTTTYPTPTTPCYDALLAHYLDGKTDADAKTAADKKITGLKFLDMMKISEAAANNCYPPTGGLNKAKGNVAKFFKGEAITQKFTRKDEVTKAKTSTTPEETAEAYELGPLDEPKTASLLRSPLTIKYVMSEKGKEKAKAASPGMGSMAGASATSSEETKRYLQTDVNTEYEGLKTAYEAAKKAAAPTTTTK